MKRCSLLIVDPNPRRREQLHWQLRLSFQTVTVGSFEEALLRFDELQPAAVIASLRQNPGHGLELCQKMRERSPSEGCFMLVHGLLRGNPCREALQRKWHVDVFLPQNVAPDVIEPLILDALARQRAERRQSLGLECRQALRHVGPLDKLKTLLFQEFYVIPPPRHLAPSELTFVELLNSRPSMETLRALIHHLSPRSLMQPLRH